MFLYQSALLRHTSVSLIVECLPNPQESVAVLCPNFWELLPCTINVFFVHSHLQFLRPPKCRAWVYILGDVYKTCPH